MPTGTLLLIDDEARLRQLLAQVLELEGYVVLQAPTPTGAWRCWPSTRLRCWWCSPT
ncbi:hypothetical protein [Hymenobacter sp. BRD67]|uniref:hypothetical protein n=1 Tax=Hymenobacter sp. BRD67 TaxID=2675877 RepID=UPI00293BA987|nr:hypothetical protein [Hymenobacter sp. BRD67]